MSVAFQFIDVAVVLVIIASTIYAAYRGFTSETLSIFAWIAAAFATLYFGPWVAYWMRSMISPAWLGEVVGYGLVFLVVVIPLSFASFRFAENIKKSEISTLDRALGAAFGIVRGLAIIGIAYLIFTAIVPINSQPNWLTGARLLPVIRGSAEVVASLIPDQHRGIAEATPQKPIVQAKPKKSAHPPAAKPAVKKHHKKTYGAKDRHALDRLIESTGSDGSGKQ